jgi:hypothetical protein
VCSLSELESDEEVGDGDGDGAHSDDERSSKHKRRRTSSSSSSQRSSKQQPKTSTTIGGVEFVHSAVAHAVVRVHATIAKHSQHFKHFYPPPSALFSPSVQQSAGAGGGSRRLETDTVRALRAALYQSMWIMMARGWWPLLPQLTHCVFSQPAMLYGSLCVLNDLLPAPLPVWCALPPASSAPGSALPAMPAHVLRVREWWNSELSAMLARAPVQHSAVSAPTPIPDPNTTDSTIVSALTLLADAPLAPHMTTGVALQDRPRSAAPSASASAGSSSGSGGAGASAHSHSSAAGSGKGKAQRKRRYGSDRSDSDSESASVSVFQHSHITHLLLVSDGCVVCGCVLGGMCVVRRMMRAVMAVAVSCAFGVKTCRPLRSRPCLCSPNPLRRMCTPLCSPLSLGM